MLNSWWKIVWKKWKFILLGVTLLFVLIQVGNMSILGLANDSTKSAKINKHRIHAAVKKVFSKWDEPQHSRMMKDLHGHAISLRGTRDKDIIKYFPNVHGKFACFSTKVEIEYVKVNDDYCDCPRDGSDEPGTSACNNGIFYCEKAIHELQVQIPSYMVNDGVCDCCDGSDEWQQISILRSENGNGNELQNQLTKCENHCTSGF